MKTRGLVLEIKGNSMIILTPEGEFRRVPLPHRIPQIGEEIEVTVGQKRHRPLAVLAAAALLFMALGGVMLQVNSYLQPASYLALDINPSLGLYLDGSQRVIRGEGINQEGRLLLAAVPVKGMILPEAMEGLVREAVAMGYVRAGADNVILTTIVPLGGGSAPPELEEVVAAVNSGLDEEHLAFVAAQRGEARDLEAARKEAVSLNKYLVRERVRARGKELPLEDLVREPLGRVLQREGTSIEELLAPEGWTPGTGLGGKGNRGQGVVRFSNGVVISGPPGQMKKTGSGFKGNNMVINGDEEGRRPSIVVPGQLDKQGGSTLRGQREHEEERPGRYPKDKPEAEPVPEKGCSKVRPPGWEKKEGEGEPGTRPGREPKDDFIPPGLRGGDENLNLPPGLQRLPGEGSSTSRKSAIFLSIISRKNR